MKKKLLVLFTCIMTFLFINESVLSVPLRYPQGRMGTGYKPERYSPYFKTNITPAELSRISEIIKQEEEEKKRAKKVLNEKLQQEKELAEELEKERARQEKLAQIEEQRLKEEQVRQEVRRIKEEKELLAQQLKEQELEKELAEKEKIRQEKLLEKEAKNAEKARLQREKQERKYQEQLAEEKTEKSESKLAFFKKITNTKSQEENTEITTEQPQEEIPVTEAKKEVKEIKNLVQDPQTRKIVKEVSDELSKARPEMLEELSLLWVNAVQKSDTVYFAIMKLSNPNGEEVNKQGFKKILQPILGAAPLIGQAFVNPAFTAGSIIGSNVMGTMMSDSAKRRLTKVNDADLVILARAIDELQETLLVNYMSYKNALQEFEMASKITAERKKTYEKLNKQNSPHVILANTFYTEALDNQYKARQEFLMKRVVLEQMVGSEALREIEQKKTEPENKENNSKK